MHFGGIGMATRAEFDDPSSIFLAIFFWPFLDEIVTEIGRGIATIRDHRVAAFSAERLEPGDRLNIAFKVGMNFHPEFGGLELTLEDLEKHLATKKG